MFKIKSPSEMQIRESRKNVQKNRGHINRANYNQKEVKNVP